MGMEMNTEVGVYTPMIDASLISERMLLIDRASSGASSPHRQSRNKKERPKCGDLEVLSTACCYVLTATAQHSLLSCPSL
jgi:hypothetical protein